VKRVITAVILIPIVVLALFKTPLWLFTLLVFGVAALAGHEYFGIAKAQGFQPMVAFGYLCLALSFGIFYVMGQALTSFYQNTAVGYDLEASRGILGMLFFWGLPVITLLAPLIFLLLALAREPLSQALPSAAASYMLLPYIAFTLGLLPIMRGFPAGALYLLFLMLLVWCGDIAAYYVGRAIGKHKLAPRISPGKSWEGAIASVLAAAVAGVLLFGYISPIANAFRAIHLLAAAAIADIQPATHPFALAPLRLVISFAICVNVAAQLGDLVESALKRGAGVKDSGTLLPGHGGMLDRIDALLFALPVGLIFYIAGLGRGFS
jgi:phosphatidate cytidylyltransferase